MPGLLEFEMELCRKAITAVAERKLSRALTVKERAGVQNINSLLQLDSICRAFNSQTYTAAEVLTDLERIAKQSKPD